jgi:hypothetical protein
MIRDIEIVLTLLSKDLGLKDGNECSLWV